MKKMLLILVSGLLILGMAGSAMAAGGSIDIVDVAHNSLTKSAILMETDDTKDIYLSINSISQTSDTFTVGITRTDSAGTPHLSANPTSLTIDYLIPGQTVYSTTPIVLTMYGASIGETYEVSVDGTVLSVQAAAEVTTVPEFPTVAAPIAGIIGLLFVFGRRKDGL
ncbi:PEF-CTERM sorting domain-containing protein [Methanosarcina sp.]|uniref:PEF-CTERM sorting domain-containing protein n=1 Tax=Methanosarcina sp. TaxID=2213 RepID=UPI003C714E4A